MNGVMSGAGEDTNAYGDEPDATSDGKQHLSSRMRELLLSATVEERRKAHDGKQSGSERRRRSDRTDKPVTRDN
jgi:hypothetical protein